MQERISEEDVFEKIERDKVEYFNLQFTDLLGGIKEVVIPKKELVNAIEYGVWFDGSSIKGFARVQESDLFLKPDLSTYLINPMQKDFASFICDVFNPNGKPFEKDPRFILKKIMSKAREEGLEYMVGPELEFYLFKEDSPIDKGGYFELLPEEGKKIVRDIVNVLKKTNIRFTAIHHEVGPGQYEIDLTYGNCLKIADTLVRVKSFLKQIGQMNNLYVSFMPKPIENKPGSGMHVHQSLFDSRDSEKNLFFDETNEYRLSRLAYDFIAGQMEHIRGMCAILNPTVNSYKRLVPGFEAPTYVSWGSRNRSSLLRVPSWHIKKPKSARVELRSPDPIANPYLAFAIMLVSGVNGIKTKAIPPKPIEKNIFEEKYNNLMTLPTTLKEALEEFDRNEKHGFLKDYLGTGFSKEYVNIKEREWRDFSRTISAWEIKKYF